MGLDAEGRVVDAHHTPGKDDRKKAAQDLIETALKGVDVNAARAELARKVKKAAPKRVTRGAAIDPPVQEKPVIDVDVDLEVLDSIPDQPLTRQKRKQSPVATDADAGKGKETVEVSSKKSKTGTDLTRGSDLGGPLCIPDDNISEISVNFDMGTVAGFFVDPPPPPPTATEPPKQKQTQQQQQQQKQVEPSRRDVRSTPSTNIPPFTQIEPIFRPEDPPMFFGNPEASPLDVEGELREAGARFGRIMRIAFEANKEVKKLRGRIQEYKRMLVEKDKLIATSAPRIKELEGRLKNSEVLSEKRWKACEAEINNRERLAKENKALLSEIDGLKKQKAELEAKLAASESKSAASESKLAAVESDLQAERQKVAEKERFIRELEDVLMPEAAIEYRLQGEEGVKKIIEELFPEGSDPPFPWTELERRERERDAAEAAAVEAEEAAAEGNTSKPTSDSSGDKQAEA
jgi:hypothetical protein